MLPLQPPDCLLVAGEANDHVVAEPVQGVVRARDKTGAISSSAHSETARTRASARAMRRSRARPRAFSVEPPGQNAGTSGAGRVLGRTTRREVLLDHALGDGERPGVLDELPHLVRVDSCKADVHPVVAKVGGARQRELLRLGLDEGFAQYLGTRSPSSTRHVRGRDRRSARSGTSPGRERPFVRARKRAREGADVVGRYHAAVMMTTGRTHVQQPDM